MGFGEGDLSGGTALATGIGLQNLPKGLAFALALTSFGYSKWKAPAVTGLTGLVELRTGLAGAYAVCIFQALLP